MTTWVEHTNATTTWTPKSSSGDERSYYFDDPDVSFDDAFVAFDDASIYDVRTIWEAVTEQTTTWTVL